MSAFALRTSTHSPIHGPSRTNCTFVRPQQQVLGRARADNLVHRLCMGLPLDDLTLSLKTLQVRAQARSSDRYRTNDPLDLGILNCIDAPIPGSRGR